MLSRINFLRIIIDHFGTLRRIDKASKGPTIRDLILFVSLPLSLGLFFILNEISIKPHLSDLITITSIIGGFLLNLLAIVYGLMDKLEFEASNDVTKTVFVKEIHINVSFNILISIFLIILLLTYSFIDAHSRSTLRQFICLKVIDLFVVFLLGIFILTMLMILNRIYTVMKRN